LAIPTVPRLKSQKAKLSHCIEKRGDATLIKNIFIALALLLALLTGSAWGAA